MTSFPQYNHEDGVHAGRCQHPTRRKRRFRNPVLVGVALGTIVVIVYMQLSKFNIQTLAVTFESDKAQQPQQQQQQQQNQNASSLGGVPPSKFTATNSTTAMAAKSLDKAAATTYPTDSSTFTIQDQQGDADPFNSSTTTTTTITTAEAPAPVFMSNSTTGPTTMPIHGDNHQQETIGFPSEGGNIRTIQERDGMNDRNNNNDDFLYRQSTALPKWMKEYFDWHRRTIQELETLAKSYSYDGTQIVADMTYNTNSNTSDTNNQQRRSRYEFLILACTELDRCGGLSDRIKPIPLFLAAAAKTRRILLIRWTRPAPLEEFLVPNEVNWTVPTWLRHGLPQRGKKRSRIRHLGLVRFPSGLKLLQYIRPNATTAVVLEGKVQDVSGGEGLYNRLVLEEGNVTARDADESPWFDFSSDSVARYQPIYHDLFHVMFRPSPPVDDIVRDVLSSMKLVPGRYTSAHLRAGTAGEKLHKRSVHNETEVRVRAINAVNCASHLQPPPGQPIYFASDSAIAMDAVRRYSTEHNLPIVTYEQPLTADGTPPINLHIEKTADWEQRRPSDFYSTFVDFLVLGSGKCIAYGGGGFGRFAGLLTYNSSCLMGYEKKARHVCTWNGGGIDIHNTDNATTSD